LVQRKRRQLRRHISIVRGARLASVARTPDQQELLIELLEQRCEEYRVLTGAPRQLPFLGCSSSSSSQPVRAAGRWPQVPCCAPHS
jgi:hypothetical protein